jgi:hypothetical protein
MPCKGCDDTGHNIKNCPEKPCGECNSTEHVKKDCLHYKEHRRKRNHVENMSDTSIEKQNQRYKRKLKPVDELVAEKCERLNNLQWTNASGIRSEVMCVKEIIYRPEIDMSFDVPEKYCFSYDYYGIHTIWRGDEVINFSGFCQNWYIVKNTNEVPLLEGTNRVETMSQERADRQRERKRIFGMPLEAVKNTNEVTLLEGTNRKGTPRLMVTIVWSDIEEVPYFIQLIMDRSSSKKTIREDAITYFREHGSLKGHEGVESLEQEARNSNKTPTPPWEINDSTCKWLRNNDDYGL